jgi:hypothetical protein
VPLEQFRERAPIPGSELLEHVDSLARWIVDDVAHIS